MLVRMKIKTRVFPGQWIHSGAYYSYHIRSSKLLYLIWNSYGIILVFFFAYFMSCIQSNKSTTFLMFRDSMSSELGSSIHAQLKTAVPSGFSWSPFHLFWFFSSEYARLGDALALQIFRISIHVERSAASTRASKYRVHPGCSTQTVRLSSSMPCQVYPHRESHWDQDQGGIVRTAEDHLLVWFLLFILPVFLDILNYNLRSRSRNPESS